MVSFLSCGERIGHSLVSLPSLQAVDIELAGAGYHSLHCPGGLQVGVAIPPPPYTTVGILFAYLTYWHVQPPHYQLSLSLLPPPLSLHPTLFGEGIPTLELTFFGIKECYVWREFF